MKCSSRIVLQGSSSCWPTPQRAHSCGMCASIAFVLPRCSHAQRRAEDATTSGGNFSISYCAALGGGGDETGRGRVGGEA